MWSAHTLLLAGRPEGCIATACGTRPYRPSEDLSWLLLVAVMLLSAGTAVFAAKAPLRRRGMVWAAAGLVATGAVLLAVGILINAQMTDSPLWWLHDSDTLGRFLPVLGGLLTGLALLRERTPPAWVGVTLLAGAALTFGFNVQNARVLLAMPIGVAWVLFGRAVWRAPLQH